jgi:hypothetical protein
MNTIELSSQGSPERNQQLIALVNQNSEIEQTRFRASEDYLTRPFSEKLWHLRWLIWGSIATTALPSNLLWTSINPEAGLKGVATTVLACSVFGLVIKGLEKLK